MNSAVDNIWGLSQYGVAFAMAAIFIFVLLLAGAALAKMLKNANQETIDALKTENEAKEAEIKDLNNYIRTTLKEALEKSSAVLQAIPWMNQTK